MSETKVIVTGISPNANSKAVADFFSFCGKIQNLSLTAVDASSQRAVIEFETVSATKTALLLSNALIVDQAITVSPYTEAAAASECTDPSVQGTPVERLSSEEIDQKTFRTDDDSRTKTSVIASLLASGYILAEDAVGKARQLDEQNQISLRLNAAKVSVVNTLSTYDQQYQISTTATGMVGKVGEALGSAARSIDLAFGVSQTTEQGKNYLAEQYNYVASTPTVQNALNSAKKLQNDVTSSIAPHYDATTVSISSGMENIRQESNRIYEEKQRARGVVPPVPQRTQPAAQGSSDIELQEHTEEQQTSAN